MSHIITRWWWIRHAPVTVANGRLYGQRNLPADISDKKIFSHLAEIIPKPSIWITTPLQRTTQTANAIANAAGINPEYKIESAFIEQNFGDWQGMTWEELRKSKNNGFHRFWVAPANESAPSGESFIDVMKRVNPAIDKLTKTYKGKNIISVAHGGSIRAAIAHALKLSPENALGIMIENCSLSIIDHIKGPSKGEEWRINTINSYPHFNTQEKLP
ncbi:MAG: histidine phosphatase family protein [Rhodospirillaceae bacterium]|nr:histidine phosphatase family protein [Alphaproteobacteria bacterium]MBR72928.1 histidine phosphatase family protein [Rhodospirillaceae bacterium]|tara:strand:- start:17809 stop:18456 length:648 start_codon:yes stop_codon:yes gene_type:complete